MKLEKPDKYMEEIKTLYEVAFPENERYNFDFLLNGRYPNYKLIALVEESKFVGFSYITIFKNVAYMVYLAIDEKCRNRGYGSNALGLLKEKFKNFTIMLSIEKPVSKIQKRRLNFYQRNNFADTNFRLNSRGVDFQVMCYGNYDYERTLEFFKLNFPDAVCF